jgi:hypothetical protein
MVKIYEKCQVVARENADVSYYLSEMRLKIEIAVSFILTQLSNIHFLKWHRSYLSAGCRLKIYLTDTYLAILSLSQYLFPYMSKHEKQFIINEKKSALAAWIYSGANDSLRSMLWKLNG